MMAKKVGIGRVVFGVLFILWSSICLFIMYILRLKIRLETGQNLNDLYLFLYSIGTIYAIGLAILSYFRFKNANKDKYYILAMVIACFFPPIHLIPFVLGIFIKAKENKSKDFPLYPQDVFLEKTFEGREPKMILEHYYGHKFLCACGKEHVYDSHIETLRELSRMRLVFMCPDEDAITCVKIKSKFFFFFSGFESLFGTKGNSSIEENEDIGDIEISFEENDSGEDIFLIKNEKIVDILYTHTVTLREKYPFLPIGEVYLILSTIAYRCYMASYGVATFKDIAYDNTINTWILNLFDKTKQMEAFTLFEPINKHIQNSYDSIISSTLDNSQKTFRIGQLFAVALFSNKKEEELLTESMYLVEIFTEIVKETKKLTDEIAKSYLDKYRKR